jgi:hypothetical protein
MNKEISILIPTINDDIKLMLFTQFATLQYVYVIKNRLAGQQAKLETTKPKAE